MMQRLVTVLCAVLVMGCSTGSPSSSPSQAGTSRSASAADQNFVVGGDRPVTVDVPASYDAKHPAPLLIVLHGYTGTGSGQKAYFHLGKSAEQRGVITAYPDGTVDSAGDQFWNATDACCDFDETGVDDSRYLIGVVTAIQARVAVDPKRVYFLGHSNGGFMSYRMACDHADVIAGIVSLASGTFADPADCRPSAAVSVVEIHGLVDDIIDFDGGHVTVSQGPLPPYPGAKQTVQTWASYDHCDPASSDSPKRVDVDADSGTAEEPAEARVESWAGCRNAAAVELWTMPDSGHVPTISKAFPDAALDFLLAHPKP